MDFIEIGQVGSVGWTPFTFKNQPFFLIILTPHVFLIHYLPSKRQFAVFKKNKMSSLKKKSNVAAT